MKNSFLKVKIAAVVLLMILQIASLIMPFVALPISIINFCNNNNTQGFIWSGVAISCIVLAILIRVLGGKFLSKQNNK